MTTATDNLPRDWQKQLKRAAVTERVTEDRATRDRILRAIQENRIDDLADAKTVMSLYVEVANVERLKIIAHHTGQSVQVIIRSLLDEYLSLVLAEPPKRARGKKKSVAKN